jgi:hypothetical protein
MVGRGARRRIVRPAKRHVLADHRLRDHLAANPDELGYNAGLKLSGAGDA